MKIKPYVEYEFDISGTFKFGDVPSHIAESAFASGRIAGVMLEYDVAEKFENLSKEGCGQGSGADLIYLQDWAPKKVQCKTLRMKKTKTKKGEKFLVDRGPDDEAGRITKSSLFDTQRRHALAPCGAPTKEHYSTWDDKHQSYFMDYDYFMFKVIDDFPVYKVLMIPTSVLYQHPDIPSQATSFYYLKDGTPRHKNTPVPNWDWPLYVTPSMYDAWVNEKVVING